LILKSLTKPYGIGGIRSAYALSSGEILNKVRERLLPWGVSVIAQDIIPALIQNRHLFEQRWLEIIERKYALVGKLKQFNFRIRGGKCPFFLLDVGNAAQLREWMLVKYHIAIRECTSFGMPQTIRIMPSLDCNNEMLLTALHEWVNG
jgi:histidinol-phosphate aminotransferase